MPEPRALQTYSTLLEDRRMIDAAVEANEPPSLVVHLLEKEWAISTGKTAHPGPGSRRFSYSQPISSLLDDIQARRIPNEFTDIFRKLDVKFFEGCLLVELHDSRPPAKGSSKPAETSIAKYVLRPTPESLWADIRNTVDSQKNWGDKEALELEARLVLSTAPPLCLDPSPTVNRIANVITRSSAYGKTSFKRKQSEDTDDDGEIIKRRKLMQLMNPRVGKPFNPTYRALVSKQKPSSAAVVPPTGSSALPAPVQNIPRPNGQNALPPAVTNPNASNQMAQVALQSQQQAILLARQRQAAGLKVPVDAQQAAAKARFLAAQAQNTAQQQVASAQAHAQAQMRAAAGAAASGAAPQVPNVGQNQANMNNSATAAQLNALQNARPFPLTLPVVKRPPTAMGGGGASPPKPTTVPPGMVGAQNPAQSGQTAEAAAAAAAAAVQQTPRMQNVTPSNANIPVNPATQMGMQAAAQPSMQPQNPLASYHQNIVNGQQNQMQQMHAQAYNAAAANVAGGIRPGYPPNYANANQYAMAAAMSARQHAGLQNGMHPQQLAVYQAAFAQQQQRMGMMGQPMAVGMPMQMQQPGYGAMPGMAGQAPNQAPNPQLSNQVNQANQVKYMSDTADRYVANMSPEAMQAFVDSRATEAMKTNQQWMNTDLRTKAKLIAVNLIRANMANQMANQMAVQAHQQAQAQAQAAQAAQAAAQASHLSG